MVQFLFALSLLLQQDEKKGNQDTQKQDLKDRQDDQEERIKDLEKTVEELKKRQNQVTSANPLTVLNPTVTVVGDFLLRHDDKRVFVDNDPTKARIDDTINFREGEIDLRAAVDPYVNGVAIFSISSEVPGTYKIDIEEFYAVVKSLPLPLWEKPPLGTQIKLGRFRTEFGINNKSHLHDLPQSDRPLVIDEFLSPDGHATNGISATSFLPSPGDTALQLTAQVLQGGGIGVAQDNDHIAYLANLNFFWPVADEHSINLSVTGLYGKNDPDGADATKTLSVDLLYRWKPLKQGEYSSFLLAAQLFYADHRFPDPLVPVVTDRTKPFGYTAFAQYQISSRLYVGVRWDDTAFLADDAQRKRQISPYFTWYTSEFFRARLSYEHTWSHNDLGDVTDGLNTILFEVVIVFGAHPAEPFWVNK